MKTSSSLDWIENSMDLPTTKESKCKQNCDTSPIAITDAKESDTVPKSNCSTILFTVGEKIRSLRDQILECNHRSIEYAREIGRLLSEQSGIVPSADYKKWIISLGISLSTSERYIGLYLYYDQIGSVESLSIAYERLRELKREKREAKVKDSFERIEQFTTTGKKPKSWTRADDYQKKKNMQKATPKINRLTTKAGEVPSSTQPLENVLEIDSQESECIVKVHENEPNADLAVERVLSSIRTNADLTPVHDREYFYDKIIKFCIESKGESAYLMSGQGKDVA